MKKEFYDALIQLTEEKNVLTDEPLKNHVTFRVGSGEGNCVPLLCITGECRRSTEDYSLMQRGRNAILYFRKWK